MTILMSGLNEHFKLKVIDAFKGLKVYEYYRVFQDMLTWNIEDINEYKINKLKSLLLYSYNHITYYKELFDSIAFKPESLSSQEDLEKIPILERDTITERQEDLINHRIPKKHLFFSSSSGTTGKPLRYVHDRNGESAGIAAGYILYSLLGWKPGMLSLHIWGNPVSVKNWRKPTSQLKRWCLNQHFFPAYKLNDPDNYSELYNLIQKTKPKYIDGYATSISSFAHWLEKHDIILKGITGVFTTAEDLPFYQKNIIEKTIGPVSNLYGCGEINGIALQPAFDNKFYIFDPHVICETIEENGQQSLIITDLDNLAMPFIRYKAGDTIDCIYPAEENNRYPFSFFKKIEGRASQIIELPGGKKIHPVNLLGGTFIRKYQEITKHKVVWNGKILHFYFESSSTDIVRKLERDIGNLLQDYHVKFKITISEELLPGPNGKFQYIEIIDPKK